MERALLPLALRSATVPLFGQGFLLYPADLLKPLADDWTSYSGDFSGKRYSLLKDVNVNTVKNLTLAWVNAGITTGCGPTGNGSIGTPMIVSGFGDGSVNQCGPARLQGG